MAYAANGVLGGQRQPHASEALGTWMTAYDSGGRLFWYAPHTLGRFGLRLHSRRGSSLLWNDFLWLQEMFMSLPFPLDCHNS